MSSDSEEELLACTPLQRIKSQVPSFKVQDRIPTSSQSPSSSNKFKSKKCTSQGRGARGIGRATFRKPIKNEANDVKLLSPAKKQFLYGVEATSSTGSQSCLQSYINKWERQDEENKNKETDGKNVRQELLKNNVCPVCMMPWDVYSQDNKFKQFHTNKCLEKDLSSKPDCIYGLDCKNVQQIHFWTFNHQKLAILHATKDANTDNSYDNNVQSTINHNSDNAAAPKDYVKTEMTRNNCARKQENNTVSGHIPNDSTSTDFNVLIDTEDVPDLDIVSVTNQSSQDQTVLFKADECRPPKNTEADNNFYMTAQVCQGISSTAKGSNKVTQNVSRQHFNQRKNNTSERKKDLPVLLESHCSDTDSEELPCEVNKSNTDKTVYFQPSVTAQSEIAGIKMDSDSSSTLSPTEEQRTHEVRSGDLERTLGKCEKEARNLIGTLEDTEEDNVLVNYVETAVENALRGVVTKVQEQKDDTNKMQCEKLTPDVEEDKVIISSSYPQHGKPSLGYGQRTASSQKCIHGHTHIDSLFPKKGDGQTSILNYFQPKDKQSNASQECWQCKSIQSTSQDTGNTSYINERGGGSYKRQGVDEWNDVMAKMKKKRTVLPSVSGSSMDSEVSDAGTKAVQKRWRGEQHKQRRCPFYKYIPDTNVVVDAFRYGSLEGVEAYFLSHFHYDHYGGLTKNFAHRVYCSEITARLVVAKLRVKEEHVIALPMDKPQIVCGFEVTLLEANHCPGSVLFLFKLKNGKTVLHTGDFRAHPSMESYPALWNTTINTLFLDTTYCDNNYDFPRQEDVLDACVAIAQRHVATNSKTLIVVGSYTIGKERVFKAIVKSLDCNVWASGDKRKTLSYLQDPEIESRITNDKKSAQVHVLSMKQLRVQHLKTYVKELHPHYSVVVAFKPTGWVFSSTTPTSLECITPNQDGNISVYDMPYSEHSSFVELRRFVQFTRPERIIPTVNVGNAATRHIMEGHFSEWLKEKKIFSKAHLSSK